MAVLIGMSGKFKGQKFEFTKDITLTGRHATNDLCLDDASVSGQHCRIVREGQKYTVMDLESTNGTRVNGVAVAEKRLKPKDILQIGNVELLLDGTDVEFDDLEAEPPTQVEFVAGPAEVPETFHTSSPFGKRRDTRRMWVIVTATLGLLVLAALVFFFVRIFGG